MSLAIPAIWTFNYVNKRSHPNQESIFNKRNVHQKSRNKKLYHGKNNPQILTLALLLVMLNNMTLRFSLTIVLTFGQKILIQKV